MHKEAKWKKGVQYRREYRCPTGSIFMIPIFPVFDPPRRPMRQRALDGHLRRFPNLDQINALMCKRMLVVCGAAGAGRSTEMLDVIMLAIGLGFLALSAGYAIACDRL